MRRVRLFPSAETIAALAFGARGCRKTPQADATTEFVYMRRLFRDYEIFCLSNALEIETSRAVIQRRLGDLRADHR